MKTVEEARTATAQADKESEITTRGTIRSLVELEIETAIKRGNYFAQISEDEFKSLPLYYKQFLAVVDELIALGYGAYLDDSGTLTVKW